MLQMVTAQWGDAPPMASPGQLVDKMAEALGLPVATVTLYDRALSEAGYRTKSGRGLNAAKVTPLDAAHLLTAVLGSAQVNHAAHTIGRYAKSVSTGSGAEANLFTRIGIGELAQVSAKDSFLDALAALIAAAASGSLLAAVWKEKGPAPPLLQIAPLIEVAAQSPGTLGEIRIAGLPNRRTAHVLYALPGPKSAANEQSSPAAWDAFASVAKRERLATDLTQQRKVTAHTIICVAELFEPELRKD